MLNNRWLADFGQVFDWNASFMRYFGHVQPVGDPVADPGHTGETIYFSWLGNAGDNKMCKND